MEQTISVDKINFIKMEQTISVDKINFIKMGQTISVDKINFIKMGQTISVDKINFIAIRVTCLFNTPERRIMYKIHKLHSDLPSSAYTNLRNTLLCPTFVIKVYIYLLTIATTISSTMCHCPILPEAAPHTGKSHLPRCHTWAKFSKSNIPLSGVGNFNGTASIVSGPGITQGIQ